MYAFVCACVCVCVCARACVRACVRAVRGMHAHAVTYSPHWLSMPVLTQEPHTVSQLACVKCLAHLSLPVDDQDAYTRTVVIYAVCSYSTRQ